MKVLFFIPQQIASDPVSQQFAEVLQASVGRYEETSAVSSVAAFRQSLHDASPDLIHMLGCPGHSAHQAMLRAMRQKLPVVVSTMSQLMPWCHPSLFDNRLKSVEQADAIHVWSQLEDTEMRKNKSLERIQLVANCVVTNSISAEQMALRMTALYQKVIDSNTFRLMNTIEKQAETLLLRKGLERDEYCYHLTAEDIQLLQDLTEDSWRKIIIHANNEDIMNIIRQGAEELDLRGINTPTDRIKRFPQKIRKPKGRLSTTELISKNHITKTIIDNLRVDEKPSPLEMEICLMMHNLNHLLESSQPVSRHYLVQAYTLLRFNDYDEDKLSRMLKRLKLDKFASRLLAIFDDTFAIGEGFSPLPLIDDRTTDHLRQTLSDLNIQ